MILFSSSPIVLPMRSAIVLNERASCPISSPDATSTRIAFGSSAILRLASLSLASGTSTLRRTNHAVFGHRRGLAATHGRAQHAPLQFAPGAPATRPLR